MLTVIVNPTAGSGDAGKLAEQLGAHIEAAGRAYRLVLTAHPGHATELAREAVQRSDCEAVIAVGGDGTLLETARGMLGSQVPMGAIPAGTGNDLIKTLGTPKDPIAALDAILTGTPRPIDVGTVNGEVYLNVAGTGFDVMVLDETVRYKERFRGLTPYMLGLLRAIAHYHPTHIHMEADDRTFDQDALICSFALGKYFGGGIPICKEAKQGDGYIDLVLVNDLPKWKIPFYLPALMMGKLTEKPFTTHILCRRLRLASPGMRFNMDGEIAAMDEAEVEVHPGALNFFW